MVLKKQFLKNYQKGLKPAVLHWFYPTRKLLVSAKNALIDLR